MVISTSQAANRAKIKKWLIMSLLKQVFSGQSDTVLRSLRDIIKQNGSNDFPLDEITNKFKGTNKSIIFTDDDIESLLDKQYGKAETHTILMLLYPSLDFNNIFHMDHMYPKSKFKKRILLKNGVDEIKVNEYIAHVNDLSNLQLLAAIPNIEKQNTDFDKWFAETYPTESDKIQYRTIHYLPDMDYSYSNFELFLSKRRELLKSKLNEMLL